jgi:hypothetical protein
VKARGVMHVARLRHSLAWPDFSALIADPEIIGLHISPKGRA